MVNAADRVPTGTVERTSQRVDGRVAPGLAVDGAGAFMPDLKRASGGSGMDGAGLRAQLSPCWPHPAAGI